MFIDATTNNNDFFYCYDDLKEDLEISENRWISILNSNIKKTFKRIRINHKKLPNEALDSLPEQKEKLRREIAEKYVDLENNLEQVL